MRRPAAVRSHREKKLTPTPKSNRWPLAIALATLAYLVAVVFFPVIGFQFVESDEILHVTENPSIRALSWENIRHILTSRCLTSYYPVRTLTYLADYQFWGPNAGGFKLTNAFFHLANVYLLFWLILRLQRQWDLACQPPRRRWDVAVAALAAALFAVHPVVVEPVAWISGREELLMTLGALGCLHFHLSARRRAREEGNRRRAMVLHLAAILCCAGACLSNAVAAVIPLLIVTCDAMMPDRPSAWKTVRDTAPFWFLGFLTIVIKAASGEEAGLIGEPGAISAQRLMLMLNVYWANLTSLVWPTELATSYTPLRPASFLERGVLLGALAVGLTSAALWRFRRHRSAAFGLLWFCIALLPSSQIVVHHIHHADRLLYLPRAGAAIAAGGFLRRVGYLEPRRRARVGMMATGAAGLAVVFVLVCLSVYQVHTWRDSIALWEQCVKAAPDNPVAHRGLADSLAKIGQFQRAFEEFEISLRLEPASIYTIKDYAFYLVNRDDVKAIELAERGCMMTDGRDPDLLMILAGAYISRAETFYQEGRFQQAIEFYTKATQTDPSYERAWTQLAHLRATCADPQLRDPVEAARMADRALQMSPSPKQLSVLGETYAAIGQMDKALAAIAKAQKLTQAAGNRELAESLERQWNDYQAQSTGRTR